MRFLRWDVGAGVLLIAAVLTAGPGRESGNYILGADPGPCQNPGMFTSICSGRDGMKCYVQYSKCKAPLDGQKNIINCVDDMGPAACQGGPECAGTEHQPNYTMNCTPNP